MLASTFAFHGRLSTAVLRAGAAVAAAATLLFTAAEVAAAPLNKCLIDGTVTFQQAPCPSTEARVQPTLDELNAAEKKKRAAAAAARAQAAAAATSVAQESAAKPSVSPAPAAPAAPAVSAGFRCDGRIRCPQMRSCAEAKYFLAHCPGVQMDGDGDGIPCEQQWCKP